MNRPDVQHFLEKLKREREAKMNTQENDNRSFIVKYVSNKRILLAIKISFSFFFLLVFSGNIYYQS